MIRVTYVLGSHDSRYTQHHKHGDIDTVRNVVQANMAKAYFDLEIADGFVRIYSNRVSAVEVRDLSTEEAILKTVQQEGV